MQEEALTIINSFHSFLGNAAFPCVAARDALVKGNIEVAWAVGQFIFTHKTGYL